ncbi:MAG: hypothetical protein OXQ29_16595, partial [Rhodospirillaceae bacterium]|nr:hypothetical protein [Rhodospirillaceae bacterium]
MKSARLVIACVLLVACTGEDQATLFNMARDQTAPPDYVDELFQEIGFTDPADPMSRGEWWFHMQRLAAVGREDRHAEVQGWPVIARQCEPTNERDPDVLNVIVDLAANTRIVIVNEAHDRPHHREFTRTLAIRLAPLGYTHFAAEALDPGTFTSGAFPYARTNYGTYINEPVFGSLVRTAIELGFVLVAYDSGITDAEAALETVEQVTLREERQASRLAEVIADLTDSERILIHVGYSHAAEVPIRGFGGNQIEWMAARLKQLTGIDPLTIDQTDCLSDSDRIQFAAASPRHADGQHDLLVAHPALKFVDGRPEWRAEEPVSQVEVPSGLVSDSARTIVEARYVDEPMDAVPIDRVMLWPGESIPLL